MKIYFHWSHEHVTLKHPDAKEYRLLIRLPHDAIESRANSKLRQFPQV